jgi:hypothetical protein
VWGLPLHLKPREAELKDVVELSVGTQCTGPCFPLRSLRREPLACDGVHTTRLLRVIVPSSMANGAMANSSLGLEVGRGRG